MNRRYFLRRSGAAAILLATTGARARASAMMPARTQDASSWIHPIGLQLYTVRHELRKDFEGTLSAVAEIGYREVELAGLYGRSASQVRAALDGLGLTAPSAHMELHILESRLSQVLDEAHVLGNQYIVVPDGPTLKRPTLDAYRRFADRLNRLAQIVARAGMILAYHNHDEELRMIDGRFPYDVMAETMDAALIKLEIDIYWMLRAGQDPLTYFARWPGRIRLIHVKDSYGPPTGAMADVGVGTIDWRRLFEHSQEAGIEHYFVERDDARNGLSSAASSFSYLNGLKASGV